MRARERPVASAVAPAPTDRASGEREAHGGSTPALTRRALLARAGTAAGAIALTACTPPTSPATPSATASAGTSPTAALPSPTPARLPRWRGFNLIEQAPYLDRPRPYDQWDFDFMAEHGFDFVRLAVGHRHFMPTPGVFDERGIAEIDRATGWARERKIHVNLDQHATPGYNAFTNPRLTTLWEDGAAGDDARRQFAEVWRALARRYKGIPANELSFNLLNEPYPLVTAAQYVRVAEPVVAAIRAEDPARVIIADGLVFGQKPVPELTRLGVAQSRHMYKPSQLAQYKAPSAEGADKWPVPTWPLQPAANSYIAGTSHTDFQSPLVLRGDFPAGAEVRITIDQVSRGADLIVRADGKETFRKQFVLGPGSGEWKSTTFRPQSNDYLAVYDRAYSLTLPAAAKEISFEVATGAWLTFSEIQVRPLPGGELSLRPGPSEFRVRQSTFVVQPNGTYAPTSGHAIDKEDLWEKEIAPWKAFADTGVGVHVGEFGAYKFTPHDVVLRWMADVLELFRRAGFGWALWNLRGAHGPVDSDRADVTYESYKGHKLDRKMLELLKTG